MSSLDFKLAMMTARGVQLTPRKPVAGIPEFTADDVKLAVSAIRNPVGFHAIMSKYCDDEYSMDALVRWVNVWSVDEWVKSGRMRHVRVKLFTLERIAELTVLIWLRPGAHKKRGVRSKSAYCQVATGTWSKFYERHHKVLYGRLNDVEFNALEDLKRVLA